MMKTTLIAVVTVLTLAGICPAQIPVIPPDTTTFWVSNESGITIPMRRIPDSLLVKGEIVIRFHQNALDYDRLLSTYFNYYLSGSYKGKKIPMSNPFPHYERGFPEPLRYKLLTEKFGIDSYNNIIANIYLKNFLIAAGGKTLKRLTTASPYDSLSVTRNNDTIGCDHFNWMILHTDTNVNMLALCYLLKTYFPQDIIIAVPSYKGSVLLSRHPCDDNTNYDVC